MSTKLIRNRAHWIHIEVVRFSTIISQATFFSERQEAGMKDVICNYSWLNVSRPILVTEYTKKKKYWVKQRFLIKAAAL